MYSKLNDRPVYRRAAFLINPRYLTLFAVLVLLFFWRGIFADILAAITRHRSWLSSSNHADNPIFNSTLGFQEIYALVLPSRSDRMGPLLATATATNLSLNVLDAVLDKEVPQSDIPRTWGDDGWNPEEGQLGCLMSHLYTWKKMIKENIASALVMESDVDWDMRIKPSMDGLSDGVKAIADFPFEPLDDPTKTKHPKDLSIPQIPAPYGDKWDLLWIGHCGANFNGGHRYYAYNDSSAPDSDHAWSFSSGPDSNLYPRHGKTRFVFELRSIACSSTYAISNRGAHKLEKHFEAVNGPVDMQIWDRCMHDPDLVCLATFPQIFSVAESRSNIKHDGGLAFGHEIEEERVVAGQAVQISARMNAHLGLAGEGPERWKKEWEDES